MTKVLYVEDNDDHALAGEREKALAAGCDEFDTKPIEFERLVATLRRVLAARK